LQEPGDDIELGVGFGELALVLLLVGFAATLFSTPTAIELVDAAA
jgi:hypothetical protein